MAVIIADSLTVIRARGRRLAKLIRLDGAVEGYGDAKHLDLFALPVADLSAMYRLAMATRTRSLSQNSSKSPSRISGVGQRKRRKKAGLAKCPISALREDDRAEVRWAIRKHGMSAAQTIALLRTDVRKSLAVTSAIDQAIDRLRADIATERLIAWGRPGDYREAEPRLTRASQLVLLRRQPQPGGQRKA